MFCEIEIQVQMLGGLTRTKRPYDPLLKQIVAKTFNLNSIGASLLKTKNLK